MNNFFIFSSFKNSLYQLYPFQQTQFKDGIDDKNSTMSNHIDSKIDEIKSEMKFLMGMIGCVFYPDHKIKFKTMSLNDDMKTEKAPFHVKREL